MAETSAAQILPLSGRVAIVTGGSRGIGKAISLHLASLGASLVIGYASNSAQADLVASEISSMGVRAIAVRADVSVSADVKALFDKAESEFGGPVHILVANAGVVDAKMPLLANTTVEEWENTFNVNAKGAFLCCKEAANRLVRGGGGRIITVSTSLVGALKPGYAAYTASKAAVEAMTKILAKELKGTMITANSIAPGPVATEFFLKGKSEEVIKKVAEDNPFGRLGEPKDIVGLVGSLCSDSCEWVNGQVIRINGGYV